MKRLNMILFVSLLTAFVVIIASKSTTLINQNIANSLVFFCGMIIIVTIFLINIQNLNDLKKYKWAYKLFKYTSVPLYVFLFLYFLIQLFE